jgi:voltage-gated potassium channel
MATTLRNFVYKTLEDPSTRWGRRFAVFITTIILLNVLEAIVETVPNLPVNLIQFFSIFEFVSVLIFTVEYILRLWACTLNPMYTSGLAGRVRYAVSPLALIDLLAIVPYYLPLTFTFDLRVIRLLRLFRIFRLVKVARYSDALHVIVRVFCAKRAELVLVLIVCTILLVISSSLLYYAEQEVQPDVFTSIPASLWWGVSTLTTVGYGDIYPITGLGKIIASAFALIGIALFALPTGILASGFAEERNSNVKTIQACPHCGKVLSDR